MPGYILHLTEAKLICSELTNDGHAISEEWQNRFALGCLLPDTLRKKEKKISHFWNEESMKYLAIPPDLKRFEELYSDMLTTPETLGYWVHIHLDYYYVIDFWNTILEFRDKEGRRADLRKDIYKVYLKHFDTEISVGEFFSRKYYYGDYSNMNVFLTKKYDLNMPFFEKLENYPIKEVDPDDMHRVLKELSLLERISPDPTDMFLKVFDISELEEFITDTAHRACSFVRTRLG